MNILISGASVAGPTLAYWLRRHGFHPTIVERAPALRPGGHAIDLRGPATEVAEAMGIMDAVREAGIGTRGMNYVDETGKRLASMPVELFGGHAIVAEIEILRGDLTKILYAATRDDTEYLFGDRITSLTSHDNGVDVTFEHAEPRTFDLVIGADGVHSGVRALAFGPESEFVHHLGYYMAFFTTPELVELNQWEQYYNAPGGRMAALRPGHGKDMTALFGFESPLLNHDPRNVAQQKQAVTKAFQGLGWQVPRMLEAMEEAADFYFDTVCQITMKTWSTNRVALLGDAAYCPSPLAGAGTPLAMVGAYVLAGELKAANGNHKQAFEAYEAQMRPYATQKQELPPGGGRGAMPRTKRGIWLRNQLTRALPHLPGKSMIAKKMAEPAPITLKQYTPTEDLRVPDRGTRGA
jgi:2-polyprenyl-6-methoxyphenol hydroxylase-like FAD-dependent oxidoreductase